MTCSLRMVCLAIVKYYLVYRFANLFCAVVFHDSAHISLATLYMQSLLAIMYSRNMPAMYCTLLSVVCVL
jgi:hypothetical protein